MDQKLILMTVTMSAGSSMCSMLTVTCWDSDFKFHSFKDIRVKQPLA